MELSWSRPRAGFSPESSPSGLPGDLVAEPAATTERPWILFAGGDEASAFHWISSRAPGLPVISPPSYPPLPIALHALPPPGISGERVLFVPHLERAFFETLSEGSFSASSPLYVLPKLVQLASEGEPLTFVATAGEIDFTQRGLASRFEIRRLSGVTAEKPSPPVAKLPLWQWELTLGLSTRDPHARAQSYEIAAEAAPEKALVQLFLASSLLERRNRRAAANALERAIELDPALAPAHYELGKILIQSDDIQGAIASFRKTTELLPEYASAWGNLGAALGEVQNLDAASEALERAVALDPRNAALRSNLGVSYRDRGKLSEAEGEFRRAVALDPEFVFGHYNLAHVLYLEGRYPEAIETFEKAQSIDRSRSPRQALLLAVTRLAFGDAEGALREYRETFGRLTDPMKADMRTVAEWDLQQLSQKTGETAELKRAASLLRTLA